MANTVITGPILDSFGQPVNGYLYGRQSARMDIDGALVTQTITKARVIDGTPFLDDGVTPLSVAPTVEGEYFEIVEDFRNYDGQVVRKVVIPESGPVTYSSLVDKFVPVSSSIAIVPGWYREMAGSADTVIAAKNEAVAASEDAAAAASEALSHANDALTTAASVPIFFDAPSLSSPRPAAAPGQRVEWTVVSDDPFVKPVNMAPGDKVDVVAPEPVPWAPGLWDALGGLYLAADATVSEGADLPTAANAALDDRSLNNRGLSTIAGTGVADVPTYDVDIMGGKPAIVFPQVSALWTDAFSQTPTCMVVGVNVKFNSDASSTADQTVVSFGGTAGTGNGRYSISRSGDDTKLQVAAADGLTVHQSATLSFGSPMSIITVTEPTRVRLYKDGVLTIDVTETLAMAAITRMIIGMVSTGTSSVLKAFRDGWLNALYWGTPAAADVDADLIAEMNNWLVAMRSV